MNLVTIDNEKLWSKSKKNLLLGDWCIDNNHRYLKNTKKVSTKTGHISFDMGSQRLIPAPIDRGEGALSFVFPLSGILPRL